MPLWVRTMLSTGPPEEVEAASRGHLAHLADLRRQGRLRAAGAFRDGDGFLDIFEAEDRLRAEAIARSSPLVEAGLVSWLVREWSELEPR